MEDKLAFSDILDRAVNRLLDGEPVAGILAAYPDRAAELASLLGPADALAAVPAFEAPAQRAQAMRRMFGQLEATATGAGAVEMGGGGLMSIFKSFRGRPLAFQAAAAAGALVLFGALGLGASAATGNGPAPVREFFGISSASAIRVEFTGTIVSIEPSTSTLVVSANGDMRTVVVTDGTEITRSGQALTLGDLAAGQLVEVKGTLEADNKIAATRLHLEDAGAQPTAPAAAPAAVPTVDDDGQSDDHGDDALDDDNSGPGNGDDGDDDHSGTDGDDNEGDDDAGPSDDVHEDDEGSRLNGDGPDDDEGPDDDGGAADDDSHDDADDGSGPGGGDDGGDD
jgi:hypothetical protein